MESLAYMVLIILFIVTMSGPVNIGLSSQFFRRLTHSRPFFNITRRIVMGLMAIAGILVSITFFYNDTPLTPKLMAILSITGNIWSIKREYRTPLVLKHIQEESK